RANHARQGRADDRRRVARAPGKALGRADLGPGAPAGDRAEPRVLRLHGAGARALGVRAGGVLAAPRSQADREPPVAADALRDRRGALLGIRFPPDLLVPEPARGAELERDRA